MTTSAFDFNADALEDFIASMTTAELEKFNQATGTGLDNLDENADFSTIMPTLGVMAAHRLGHRKITEADLAAVPFSQIIQLVEKAAKTSPHRNQRTADLLAELGE